MATSWLLRYANIACLVVYLTRYILHDLTSLAIDGGGSGAGANSLCSKERFLRERDDNLVSPTAFHFQDDPSMSSTPASPFAYVFFMGGVTATPNPQKDGLLYNILVSAQILRDSGSKADMILLVHTVGDDHVTLSRKQERMLYRLGINIRYTPATTHLDSTNFFATVALQKFRVFGWTEYSRILFMDADIMPHCNLDYLFHHSSSKDAILEDNVLVSIGDAPASPSFFLIKPVQGRYQNFLHHVATMPHNTTHYTHEWKTPSGDYNSVSRSITHPLGVTKAMLWKFKGRKSDVGLLYGFMRYKIMKNVSIIVGEQVYTLKGGKLLGKPDLDSPIHKHSCLRHKDKKAIKSMTSQEYHTKRPKDKKKYSPSGLVPYQDIAQWSHDEIKPWNLKGLWQAKTGAAKRWFKVLSKLDVQHKFGLGLGTGEFIEHIPQQLKPNMVPLGGITTRSLEVWAQQEQLKRKTIKLDKPPPLPPTVPTSSSSSTTTTKKQKRAFVCITGQLERLELIDKVEKFFRPIQQLWYQLDVALVVTKGASVYTNHDMKFNTKTIAPFYTNYADAAQDLTYHDGINLLSLGAYEKMENPPLNQKYYGRLYEKQKKVRTKDKQMERVLNHARIFESYNRCLIHAEKAVEEANKSLNTPTTLENYYDVFMRMRDDVGFERFLPPAVLNSVLNPSRGSVQVTGCRCWFGMNDRFASIAPDVARTYFSKIYPAYISGEVNDLVSMVHNPETFLLTTFAQAGIHVLANKDLKGISKRVINSKGESMFAPGDISKPSCLPKDSHLDHLLELYGWQF